MLQATIASREDNNVQIQVTVPAEVVETAVNRIYTKLSANRSVKGFRKGKVPRHVLTSMFSLDGVQAQALQDFLIPDAYHDAITQLGLTPIGSPDFEPFPVIEEGKDLVINIKSEVLPDITLCDITSIDVDLDNKVSVTPQEIDETILGMRKRVAAFSPVSRACQDNDRVHLDYEIKVVDISGKEPDKDYDKLKDLKLTLGDGEILPDIEKNIVGMAAGEEKNFVVKYPEHYQNEEIAGKSTSVTVKVHSVEERILPEIDDAFLQKIGGFTTVEALREDLTEKMGNYKKREHLEAIRRAVVEKVVRESHIDIPESIVEEEVDYNVKRLKTMLEYRGQSFEQALAEHGDNEENYMSRERAGAKETIKRRLILSEIFKTEKLTISSDEMQMAIAEFAAQNDLKKSDLKKVVKDHDQLDEIRSAVKQMKTIALLVSRAKFRNSEETAAPAVEAAAEGETKE